MQGDPKKAAYVRLQLSISCSRCIALCGLIHPLLDINRILTAHEQQDGCPLLILRPAYRIQLRIDATSEPIHVYRLTQFASNRLVKINKLLTDIIWSASFEH